jgi:type I restriction enzyme M protein
VLGEAYEYLIERFADDAGKKGGEFATPKQVVKLMVELVAPEEGMTVYDPACGWGGILVDAVHFMERHGLNPRSVALFGQERNLNTWAIAKMSMFLHDIEDAEIKRGDTLREPKHLVDAGAASGRARRTSGEALMVPRRFDLVLANPPFSLENWGHEQWSKGDRYGRVPEGPDGKALCPPRSYGEYAFILHMIASLKERPAPGDRFTRTGRMAVVVPHGVLFRGGAEGRLRAWMLEQDLVSAVVGLGPNLFYGTGIPAAILLLDRMKPPERQGRVLVVNGGAELVEGKNQNTMSDANVARLAEAVRRYQDEDRFSRVVTLDEIRKNEHTLNIARYVDLSEAEAPLDLGAELAALRAALTERDAAEAEMWRALTEIGLGEA